MHLLPDLLLLLASFAGGALPLISGPPAAHKTHLLLAFSGSALLGITCLHLLPETFQDLPEHAGVYLLAGFFLQLLIQRTTHGVEHGHVHQEGHGHGLAVTGIFAGLALHAFMEGLPLSFHYRDPATGPSLYLAVGLHKLPEAMILGVLLRTAYSRSKAAGLILLFSCITPAAALLAAFLGIRYGFMAKTVTVLIPVVAGAFIHISTTIFFESGTKHHLLSYQKIAAMAAGVALAALTLLLH
ncbi:MAG: ZIP family metal transporter [Bacteroidetes bacterium]|nr:ZIP family metal transporter [Bacteroidota bacterium]